jgi:hypothetical protein
MRPVRAKEGKAGHCAEAGGEVLYQDDSEVALSETGLQRRRNTLAPDNDFDFKFGPDRFHRAKSGTLILPECLLIIHLAGHVAYTGFCLVYVKETLWGIKPALLLLSAAFSLAMYRFL